MIASLKSPLKKVLPAPLWRTLSLIRWRLPRIVREWRDLLAVLRFLCSRKPRVSLKQRFAIVKRLYAISFRVSSPHKNYEILRYIETILSLPQNGCGVVVEAGCYKGIGTAKFSLAANLVGRELVVFDSFRGIPKNDEAHERNIFGGAAHFGEGDYCASLAEVTANVTRYGEIACCRFVEGWFEESLPKFNERIAAIYLDVDLASSTRTCLKHLYPLLEKGGVLWSQDGHLPLVIDVFRDDAFWENEVGCARPKVAGLGRKKLIRIVKQQGPAQDHG